MATASQVLQNIRRTTGVGRRIARPAAQRAYAGRRVQQAASTFMSARPTARMRMVARRRSLGGAGG